jgi:phosphate transport system substrate-binding protein
MIRYPQCNGFRSVSRVPTHIHDAPAPHTVPLPSWLRSVTGALQSLATLLSSITWPSTDEDLLNRRYGWIALGALGLVAAGCGGESAGSSLDGLSGSVEVDGSSTVYPITEAVAEEFMAETGGSVRVTVGVSGSGGGFRRFCAGETDISNSSRHILQTEIESCAANGIEYLELPVASDGLAIVVHPSNDFVQCLTVNELRRIWEPGSTVQSWAQVREGFPDRPLRLYGPGTNSGTFDYFTEEIGGRTGASRSDYTASEDDNVLVQGVSGDVNSLGYFGFAYYIENQSRLKVLGVDNGSGCVTPSPETIESGTYEPLSRPLYLYVKRAALQRPEVRAFVEFYLDTAGELAGQVGYVGLTAAAYDEARSQLAQVADAR